jgi:hypothetical protein
MRRLTLLVATVLFAAIACTGNEPAVPTRAEAVRGFCERASELQTSTPDTEDLGRLSRGFRSDAAAFRALEDDKTADRVAELAADLEARAEDPVANPPRAVDARLLSLCLSGSEG